MIGPKVVSKIDSTGQSVFWCPKHDRQIIDQICYSKYFSRYSRECRKCLGLAKRQRFPEPWASLGEDPKSNTIEIDYTNRPAPGHNLIVESLDDAMARCSCDKWFFSFTGKATPEEIGKEYQKHINPPQEVPDTHEAE